MVTKIRGSGGWISTYSGTKARTSSAWLGSNGTAKVWNGESWEDINSKGSIPVVGTMASDFSITLGSLPSGTYTLAYINDDGESIGYDDIGEVTV